jgi:branched-chain amino acid transport system permease protein
MAIFSLVTIGLNLQWGETGLLNIGQSAFFAVGAYTTAVLTTATGEGSLSSRTIGFQLPPLLALGVATVVAGVFGALLAVSSKRVSDDYFGMVTLSFATIVLLVASNEAWLTNGTQGITAQTKPLAGLVPIDYGLFYFLFTAALLVVCFLVFRRISNSPFGRSLRGVREDERVTRSFGKNTLVLKIKAFGLGTAIAGLAGGLWFFFIQIATPNSFSLSVVLITWVAVIVGGTASYSGAVLGTWVFIGLQQATRFLPSDIPFSGEIPFIRQMMIGAVLILVLYYRPQGLLGDKYYMVSKMEQE